MFKKRLVTLLLAAVLTLTFVPAAVAAGAAAGYYYYTDIETTLWGVPINAISIGGRTRLTRKVYVGGARFQVSELQNGTSHGKMYKSGDIK